MVLLRFARRLQVRDTYGVDSAARVLATVQHAQHGPLLLVHFDGRTSQETADGQAPCAMLWLHPHHDAERIMPWRPDGVGSFGLQTATTFAAALAKASHAHTRR